MSKIKLFSGMDFSGKTTIINGINEKMPSKFSIKKKFLTPIDLIENVRKRDTWLSPEEWKPLLQENIQKDIKEYKENGLILLDSLWIIKYLAGKIEKNDKQDEEEIIILKELLKKYPINTSLYRIKTPYSHVIEESLPLISEIKNNSILYILILSIFNIGVFSLFMYILYHFIKKDIGILKCLGAKAKDIYKAQILIDLIIIILTMLVCIPVSIFSVNLINHVISSNLGFTIHYLYFDIKVIFYLSILLITTVFLASILPIRKIMNLNPIEVLRKEKI